MSVFSVKTTAALHSCFGVWVMLSCGSVSTDAQVMVCIMSDDELNKSTLSEIFTLSVFFFDQ